MNFNLAAAIRRYPGYVRALGWILLLAAAVSLGTKVTRQIDRPTNIFPTYFTAAHLVVEGQAIAKFYDQEWFDDQVDRFVPDDQMGGQSVHASSWPETKSGTRTIIFLAQCVGRNWSTISITGAIIRDPVSWPAPARANPSP